MAQKRTQKSTSARNSQNARTSKRNAAQSTPDMSARMDIAGVILTALGIALFVAVVSKSTGVMTNALSWGMKEVFGIGAFVLPIALIFWGISFFMPRASVSEVRVAVGLSLIFVSVVSFAALPLPVESIFDAATLSTHGGYLGSSITWVLVKLTGPVIAGILLGAVGCVGLVVLGLSFSRFFAFLTDWLASVKQGRAQREEITRAPKEAKTRQITGGRHKKNTEVPTRDRVETYADSGSNDETIAIPERSKAERPTVKKADVKTATPSGVVGPQALEGFELPDFSLLAKSTKSDAGADKQNDRMARATADVIVDTLNTFDVPSNVVDWISGPTVTLFKIDVAKGIRLSKITSLDDELALALAAPTLRILAPIPGEQFVGIEVPNTKRSSVTLGDVLPPAGTGGPLALALGKDVAGKNIVRDLDKMPHLLIAGTTGSGKSVCINSMLMSMIMRATPSEVRLILVDPKRVEMTLYNDIPHLYVPTVTEPQEAAAALSWAVNEMERRLKIFSKLKVRDIGEYNVALRSNKAGDNAENLPFLVIVIDELADLMMVAAKDVETSIVRIAQKARAAGIHLIIATQRPEANVVTGLIKSNITNRIAFNVGSSIDSRVILDQVGAEKLTGNGDMLYIAPEWSKPKRIQGCYVSTKEVEAVTSALRGQIDTDYHEEILSSQAGTSVTGSEGVNALNDEYIWPAAEFVVSSNLGSTSSVQRHFSIGYSRAGRIIDTLEEIGVVGPRNGSKPREVLVDLDGLENIKRMAYGEQMDFEDDE